MMKIKSELNSSAIKLSVIYLLFIVKLSYSQDVTVRVKQGTLVGVRF